MIDEEFWDLKITAVGRLLKPKGTEPRIVHRIALQPDGTYKTVIRRIL